jgi:glycosyltransferase involved in cell wall biosynthesis
MAVRRLRIAFVYDALYPEINGGGERRNYELGKRLAGRHDVTNVSWDYWAGTDRVTRDGMRLLPVGSPRPFYDHEGKRSIREAMAFAGRLFPAMLRNRFDIIDCSATPYVPLYACWLASRLTRTPLVSTWFEYWGDSWADYLPGRPVVARVARWTEAGARRFGDVVMPISTFTARRMGLDPASPRVRVMGLGVPLEEIAAAPLAQDAFEIVFVGRLTGYKRVDLLLDAVRRLRGESEGPRCVIVGDGPDRSRLETLAATLGLEQVVKFAGRLEGDQLYGQLKAAKVYVQPSAREGYSLTVVEAQACGAVPVVVRSALSAAPDLIHDRIDGVLVDPTGAALAEGIAELLADPQRLQSMRAAAIDTAGQLGWDAIAARVEEVYLSLAG